MGFKNTPALRIDPADFESMESALDDAHTSATTALDLASDEIEEYVKVQHGPDVRLVVSSARKTIEGVRSTIESYPVLADAFGIAYSTTCSLELDSDTLSQDVLLFEGEMTALEEEGFQKRFDDIRTAEESAMATLADAIDEAETGEDIQLDAGVAELIERLIGIVQDVDIDTDLAVAHLLVTDYAEDGDFDTTTDIQESLEDGGFSPEEVEILMAEGVDSEIRDAVLEDGSFGDRFSDDEFAKLLSGDIDSDLVVEILDDPELDFPDEEIMDSVSDAMAEGQTPVDAEIDKRYFPPWYLEYQANEAKIDDANERRDGAPLLSDWRDQSDEQESRERIDAELAGLKETRKEFEEKYSIGGDGKVNKVAAISTTGERTGGDHWKGETLGEVFEEGDGREAIASEVAEHPESATAFFNHLGVEETASLPTTLSEDPELIEQYSDALGEASKVEGDRALNFSGAEVINADIDQGEEGLPAEVIFLTGDFDEEFLGSATEASIRKRDTEDGGGQLLEPWSAERKKSPPYKDRSQESSDYYTKRRRDELEALYGTDATNIMLGRANESPEAVGIAFDGLAATDDVDLLLIPEDEYVPDDSEGVEGEEMRYPITEFLATAGQDERRAEKIFVAHAESGEDGKSQDFQNPGVAAGFGFVMGHHSTVTFDDGYIDQHGIWVDSGNDRISQSEFEELGFDNDDWISWQAQVNEQGGGLGLVLGTEQLIREAIRNDLADDGELSESVEVDGETISPYEDFGLTLGVMERNATQGIINYNEGLDGDAENTNKQRAALTSTMFAITALATTPLSLPTGAAVSVGGVLAGSDILLSYVGLANPEDTGNLSEALKKLVHERSGSGSAPVRLRYMATEEAILAAQAEHEAKLERLEPGDEEPEYPIVDRDGNKVRIEGGVLQIYEEGEWVDTTHQELRWSSEESKGAGVGDTGSDVEGTIVGPGYLDGYNPERPKDLQNQLDKNGVVVDVQYGHAKKDDE